MAANILEIEDLSISYADRRGELLALRNVNLTVPRGTIVGIAGESGCGKSTLISSIFRLPLENASVRTGRIRVDGADVLRLREPEVNALRGRAMAMVFQNPFTALNPVLSIERQLRDVQHREAGSASTKRQRAVAALRQVGIPDPESRIHHYPHQFSGGMLQRICIAMALLVRPALLVADEPTTSLDATMETQILQLLRDFHESTGASILLVSHHLNVLAGLCQRVAVMYAGELVEEADTDALFRDPLHPYTRLLVQCDPARIAVRSRRLPSIPGSVSTVTSQPQGCVFAPRCPEAHDRCRIAIPVTGGIETRRVKCHLFDRSDAA